MNLPLALRLALGSLRHHIVVSVATVLGVALGMAAVSSILVIDANTGDGGVVSESAASAGGAGGAATIHIRFERPGEEVPPAPLVPTQRAAPAPGGGPGAGAEDYQAMRLAVRLASLLAFFVGAVIVFYTMRFSVAVRVREFCLLSCLGERRLNAALSLVGEAAMLGGAGTLIGAALALPAGHALVSAGISTNGTRPLPGFAVPWGELAAMALTSVCVALMGVVGPVRDLMRLDVATALQPRFLTRDGGEAAPRDRGHWWLGPPLVAAGYVALRPFLQSWLSVVEFFLFEASFVVALTASILWFVRPVLDTAIRFCEVSLARVLPLEALLTGRRMRLTSRKLSFSVMAVTLVFALLTGLHDVTRSLRDEVYRWSAEALLPYAYVERTGVARFKPGALRAYLDANRLYMFRMSAKGGGPFPFRAVVADDINRYLAAEGRPLLRPGTVIPSKTLAARFGLKRGYRVVLERDGEAHRFEVIDIADDIGYLPENGPYVRLKSYALVSEGNPIFAGTLERSLGAYAALRRAGPGWSDVPYELLEGLAPVYEPAGKGINRAIWQIREIKRDFAIFDFILALTVALGAIGVANTMLIQVRAREREFSVLRAIGIGRWQVARMLAIEGAIIGFVSGVLALALGNLLGMISVSFLDHFTLFDYAFRATWGAMAGVVGLSVVTCVAAAIYPATVAVKTSSAESLHYE